MESNNSFSDLSGILNEEQKTGTTPGSKPQLPVINRGDFYWADGQQIQLLQRANQISLTLTQPTLSLNNLLEAGKPLDGFKVEKTIASNTYILETEAGTAVALPQVKEQLTGIAGATVAPVFESSLTNSWLVTTNEIIVALKPGVNPQQFLDTDPRFAGYRPLSGTPDQFVVTLKTNSDLLTTANALQSDTRLQWAAPNFYQQRERFFTPNDPLYSNQWHLNNTGQVGGTPNADVDGPEAWDVTPGGSANVVIAVIDDGMQFNHPDLQVYVNPGEIPSNGLDDDGNGWIDDVNGWDFTSAGGGDNNPGPSSPDDAHATSVAGVAAARGNNSLGVTGIAYQSRVLPVRIFDVNATTDANIASAIYYAAGRKASGVGTWQAGAILNNSWGGGGSSTAITNAFTWASSNGRNGKGAISFIATGNDSANDVSYPAELSATIPGVIAVGASTNLNQRATYSNYGPEVDFVAPSGGPTYGGTANIVTTDRTGSDGYNTTPGAAGDYTTTGDDGFSGTSSATPLAAGIGALVLARDPNLTAAQVRGLMRNTTDLIGPVSYNNNGFNQEYGYGKVNANAAVRGVGIAEIQVLDNKINIPDNAGSVNFSAPVGGNQVKTFRVRNQGTSNLTLGAITFGPGSGFTLDSGFTDTTLSVGESTTFAVRFAPTAPGSFTNNLSFTNNDADEGPFNFTLNGSVSTDFNFSNPAPITIPSSGAGNPYPSTINVSGLSGTITKVTATLNNLSHTWPDDIDILLVGPGGQKSLLMSDVGSLFDVSGLNLTFDQTAAASLPDDSLLTSGTYLPTDFETGDTFNPPAPGGAYNADLSPFNGTNPNGTWSLYVMDDAGGDSGSIAQGWSLSLQTGQQPPGSISGMKWNDLNGNGVKDTGEPGLANWQIYIDQDSDGQFDAGEPSQTTNALGNYTFSNLQAGTYVIGEVQQQGWQQTFPGTGGNILAGISADASTIEKQPGFLIPLRAVGQDSFTVIPPPEKFPTLETAATTATINVTYNGFTPQAQATFQYAVDIWESLIASDVTIEVDANWTPLGTGILGSAGPNGFWRDFTGAPQTNTWYPVPLANKLAGTDLDPADKDITANFSSNFSNWYFGTDGNTPAGQYDFASVVLHELGHGLGFLGLMQYSSGQGSWGLGTGFPGIYDRFTENGAGQSLIDTSLFPNPSVALGNQLTSNNIFFDGPKAVAANSGNRPKLYAPSTWQQGSSYSHLDESTYPAGNPNSLMTPQIGTAEAIHNPGAISLGIFEDMGWSLSGVTPTPGTHTVTLAAGQNVTGKDFGNKQTQPAPTLSITDANVIEGLDPNAVVTVNLSAASSQTITVDYKTADGTALAGSDYTTKTGTLTFAPGDTSETIDIDIIDNNLSEVDETFKVDLSNPTNATISDGLGIVTISDTLQSAATKTLPATIENLQLIGGANIDGTGNANGNKLNGNTGNNKLNGLGGNDTINGGNGNDNLNGGAGNDNLNGGNGNDTFTGGAGNDLLNGGAGNDTYTFDTDTPLGSDTLTDGAGVDTLNFASTTTKAVTVNLGNIAAQVVSPGPNLTLTLTNATAFENAIGGSLGDTLTGNTVNNSLNGGDGNDNLNGGAGNDLLNGGNGNDNLNGGAGNDLLLGGQGKDILTGAGGIAVQDTFTYNALNESLRASFDVVKDYLGSGASPDRLNAPATIPAVNLNASKGTAANISAAAIQAVLTAAAFGANTAAAFKVTGFSGTFIAFNNGVAGFQEATDTILQLENYNISGVNPVVVI